MILPVPRLILVGTSARFFVKLKRLEDVLNQGISAARTDQPPGRIRTTPVETVVEAGLTGLVSPPILILPEAAFLIPPEAVSLNLLEAVTNPLQKETTGRVEIGLGLKVKCIT